MTIQNIPPDFIAALLSHGYLILFLLVFLQEVGVPNSIPNELILVFSGYLVFSEMLNLFQFVLAVFAGDLLGSGIPFTLFFLFGKTILEKKPKWIPISKRKLDKLSRKIQRRGFAGVFVGRMMPFIRGYVAVLLGLMNYPVKKYLFVVNATALFWSAFYVTIGFAIGPYWNVVSGYIIGFRMRLGVIPVLILTFAACCLIVSRWKIRKRKSANTQSFERNVLDDITVG